ncbi:uncharacterized protein RHOBADRAFT_56316 [Rhodotorula graminis WP1]|uniref:Uncharacterized protein n=1 Tax=Rhodotorula graminis (strain WP1) TaxID=578459 RepID=A0A0N8PZC5_RHOGW|nr:uncharacterized protein RHOBADRAFT_56316 [Rhodotorula graminis WP1]KPV71941.1 hypothetical protein RHOBADRAFT_56316 [Rhodotorula graminis WP1]
MVSRSAALRAAGLPNSVLDVASPALLAQLGLQHPGPQQQAPPPAPPCTCHECCTECRLGQQPLPAASTSQAPSPTAPRDDHLDLAPPPPPLVAPHRPAHAQSHQVATTITRNKQRKHGAPGPAAAAGNAPAAHSHSSHSHSKPKRPPPAAATPAPAADGSAAPPLAPADPAAATAVGAHKPVLPPDGSVKTCEAVDRYDELCDEVVVGGWKGKVPRRWCQMHEDEEKHVRASFWSAVSSLPRLSRSHPLPSPAEITSSTTFAELEGWEQTARQHVDLAKRAYDAWVFHREHFFAAGGDLVDRLEGRGEGENGGDLARGAWEEVRLRGEKAEAVLKLIIRRSHFLVCDAEDALWLLHPQGRCGHGHYGHDYGSSSSQASSCVCSHDHAHDCDHSGDEDGGHWCDCESGDEGDCCSGCAGANGGGGGAASTHSSFATSHHHHHHHHHHHGGGGAGGRSHHHGHQHPPAEKAPHNPLRPPGSPTLAPESEEPDPLLALETLRRTELLELLSLTGSHASFIREGRKSVERVRIVECLFRRLISRDEELLVKAYRGGHDHVLRFFEDPALVTLPALARLHRALQRTSPLELKEAIMDAFRAIAWEESGATETEEGDEGVGMQVLGGWVYKNQLERSMTPREWAHLYDLCACAGCATRCCMRFADLAFVRRLTVIPHGPHPPPFELWADAANETDADRVLKALDVVWCAGKEDEDDRRPRKMRQPGGAQGAETVWALREERNWAFLKLSVKHPHALSILGLLSQFFTLLVRSRLTPSHPLPSFPLPPAAHLWTHRIRTAPTKAILARATAAAAAAAAAQHTSSSTTNGGGGALTPSAAVQHPWRALPNPFNLSHSAMHVLAGFDALDSPEKEQEMQPFDEAYELLVLDAPSDSPYAPVDRYLQRPLAAFDNFLAATIARACGIKVPGVTVFDDDDEAQQHVAVDEARVAAAGAAQSASVAEAGGPTVNCHGNGNKKRAANSGGSAATTVAVVAPANKPEREQRGMDMSALVQAALEHGAVECFLRGDLVWDFGDVKGVTTGFGAAASSSSSSGAVGAAAKKGQQQQQPYFGGIDLKKVGKDGIVAPPMPAPQANGTAGGAANGAGAGPGKKGSAGKGGKAGGGGGASAAAAAAAGGAGAVNGKAPATEKERKERVLDGLRDDKLARRLARSLFK